MGRGAGNTPTELLAQYMVSKLGYTYDIDSLLDIIDEYMDNIRSRCSWGYDTHYFIAGAYSAHVNNIYYLQKKNSIKYKDIRYILNKIGAVPRKRYHYDLLEETYLNYLKSDIDDSKTIQELNNTLKGKNIVIIAPRKTAKTMSDTIIKYIQENDSVVISVNFRHDRIKSDYMYFSNVKRYSYWSNDKETQNVAKILTSNITDKPKGNEKIVSFVELIKCGSEHMDNSVILLLRLLDKLNVRSVALAGLDGFDYQLSNSSNYASSEMELSNIDYEESKLLNKEIEEMLKDFLETKVGDEIISFITPSRFDYICC